MYILKHPIGGTNRPAPQNRGSGNKWREVRQPLNRRERFSLANIKGDAHRVYGGLLFD